MKSHSLWYTLYVRDDRFMTFLDIRQLPTEVVCIIRPKQIMRFQTTLPTEVVCKRPKQIMRSKKFQLFKRLQSNG